MANVELGGNRQVGFIDAIGLFFKNYVNFQGRSSRGAYWWYFLFSIVLGFILGFIDGFMGAVEPNTGLGLLGGLFSLATLIPGIALGVRRLHDTGKSGWWILIYFTIIGILVLIFFFAQPGERSENKYGPDQEAGRPDLGETQANVFS